jgi:CBS domain containing-hemolysin-like protein
MITIASVVFVLLLLNALFVAAEFAIVSAPRATMERRAQGGDRLAARLLDTMTSPRAQDQYIATAQIGITLASLGLGMYGEHTLALWLEPRLEVVGAGRFMTVHALASVVAVTVLSYLHIFLGEMIPKGLALSHAEATARAVFLPMSAVRIVLLPFVLALNRIGNACLRLIGVRRQENPHELFYTPEELRLVVDESRREGALRADAASILRELFEFGDLTAGQAMVPRVGVVGLPSGASPADVRRILAEARHTRYPVFEGSLDHIVGMLHVKDLLRRLVNDEPISSADVRRIPFVPETTPLDDVLATMQRTHAHMAVVIDEHGGTAGIISLEDLFEEVVGEIDEGVPRTPALAPQPDGSVRAAGTVRLDELGRCFDLDLEHEEVESVSGLVLAQLGRPPVVGDVVEYGRIRLAVTATTGRGVREVRAERLPAADNDIE